MEYNYISIKEILNRVLRHPLLSDVDLDNVIYHTLDFFRIFGIPKMYMDKEITTDIKDYRGLLPCDLIKITQVKNTKTNLCMRSMTDNFNPSEPEGEYIEDTFKTQGTVIYTSFKEGRINISYKSLPVDENGYPLLIDNEVFLKGLELYIKKEEFSILFDLGKINIQVLNNAQQQYSWIAGQIQSEFLIPSVSEMESISRMWTSLIQNNTHFDKGFRDLGNREYIRRH